MEQQRTDQQVTWRRTIRAAGVTLLLGLLAQTSMAQADAWILANSSGTAGRWADLAPANATVAAAVALPTPGGANGYAGQAPAYSQHIRTNGEGGIIFFAVDGHVYNGDGYRISDALGPNCNECRHPGTMEFLSVPVPGSCSLYYLFSAHPSNLGGTPPYGAMVQVSILDMSRFTYEGEGSETWDCTRPKGRLLAFNEIFAAYPQFDDWVFGDVGPTVLPNSLTNSVASAADKVRSLWVGQISAKGNSPQIRIVDGASPGDDAFLFFRTASTVRVYRISADGVFPVQQNIASGANNAYIVPLDYTFNNPVTVQPYHVDTDVRRLPNGTIRLAATNNFRFTAYPATDPTGNVISMDFNGNTGVMVPQSNTIYRVAPPPNDVSCGTIPSGTEGGAAGCAISPSGDRIYITMESSLDCVTWTPLFGYVDINTQQFTDLNPTVGVPMAFMNSRIIRDRSVNSNAEALYLLDQAGNIGMVEDYAGSAPTFSIASTLAARAPAYPVLPSNGGNVLARFLNPAVEADNHLSADSKQQCCTYFETVPGAAVEGYTHSTFATTTWTGGQNDLRPGQSTIVFTCDVIVEPGTTLLVNNMEWRFMNNARLIVRQGGYLRLRNSTLTGLECEDQRWPGVQVHGSPAAPQQGFGQFQIPVDQGKIELFNSIVSNAHIGVFTGTLDVTILGVMYNLSNDGGGGVVIATGATFLNCATGVDMRKYQAPTIPGQPAPLNQSRFTNTRFVVDRPNLSALYPFKRHVRLDRVNGVLFRQCDFRNDVDELEYQTAGSAALGYGIESYESLFQVLPGCSILLNVGQQCPAESLLPSTFTGLDHGINAIGGPNAQRNFTVDAARFTDNICGVYTSGVIGFVARRNTFQFGNRNVPLTNSLEANWLQAHRGLYSFKGSRFTVMDNTLLQSGTKPTEGIVIGFSGEEDEIVFRNNASNLVQAYIGEGQCANDTLTASQGLWFKCNTNQHNTTNFRSRIVTGGGPAQFQTIRTNQGSIFPVVVPADNQFDQDPTGRDFVNDGCDYNAISYWWADPVSPYKPEYTDCVSEDNDVNGVPIERSPSNCLTRTRERAVMPTTTEGLVQQAEAEKLEYANQRYLYDQLMDGGNTDEVLLEISSAWPQEAWDLRAYLLSKSPFLSVEVLQEAVNKAYFPMAMKAEVCIANPDATKKDGFMKWLQYDALFPMPEHLLASIEASWDQKTYRTNLENALAMHRSELVQSLNQVTEILTGDTVYDPTDSLRAVWQVLRSPGARYAEALLLMQQGQLNEAHAVVSAIPTEHELRPKELDERGRMLQVIALMQAVKASDRSEAELTVAEQNNLAALVEGQLDRPSVWAQNLLCWFYDRCTVPPSGGDETPKSAKPQRRPLVVENAPMLAVQPNPATTWATFTITLDHEPVNAMVVVRDAQGRITHQELVNGPEVQLVWDTRQMAQGLYSVELLEDGKRLQAERLIVQP